MNIDTKLFFDPLLMEHSNNKIISSKFLKAYKGYFDKLFRLLKASKKENDTAWKGAYTYIDFKEAKGSCLGYGAGSTSGRGLSKTKKLELMRTAKEIIDIGVTDPDLIILLPLLEEGIGPDYISDITISILEEELLGFTNEIAKKLSIQTQVYQYKGNIINVIMNPCNNQPLLLLPTDVLRELPIATDFDSICKAAAETSALREKINRYVTEIWVKNAKRSKAKLKENLTSDKASIEKLIKEIKSIKGKPYNFITDDKALVTWHEYLEKAHKLSPAKIIITQKDKESLIKVIDTIISQYKFLIEKHGVNKLLWNNGKPNPEKVSQYLFFASAYSYCRANDIDINPEMDTGNGLLDFKFSVGFKKRVIVEIKLTTSKSLVHGYEKQIEIYKESEETECGYYVVIDVGGSEKSVKSLRDKENAKMSKIFFIDGHVKKSASKR